MRRHWLICGTVALAIAAGSYVSTGGADDRTKNSSWTSKLWSWSSSKKIPEGQRDAFGQPVDSAKADQDAARRLRAELDWKRRGEVCQKLRQIAFETNDEGLDRFADQLDQRAWDVYVKQSGSSSSQPFERIGIDFNDPTPANKTVVESPKTREDR